jgi:PAS domain S-box-containing protein
LAILVVVVGAVLGVAALRREADRGGQAEILLVRLDGLTQEQYAQLGRAVSEGAVDGEALARVRASRAAFDATYASLRSLGRTHPVAGLPADVAAFRASADAAFGLVADGHPALAGERLRAGAAPAVDRVLGKLSAAAAASGDDARQLRHRSDLGSLGVLLAAGCIVWLLLRQGGRARRDAARSHAEMETQQRFRSLVQNSSDVITVVDAAGVIRYQTPSVTQVFGYDADDLVGRELATLVHPDDLRDVQRTLLETASAESVSQLVECRVQHADGSWRHVETAVSNRLGDPQVGGMILNARDITER